jgi:hypothetical protein
MSWTMADWPGEPRSRLEKIGAALGQCLGAGIAVLDAEIAWSKPADGFLLVGNH